LIIGGALLFGPLSCGSAPTVGTACTESERDCDSSTKTGYYCENGRWTSVSVASEGCDCFVDPSSGSCPVIGYVGIDKAGEAEAQAARPRPRRIRDRLAQLPGAPADTV